MQCCCHFSHCARLIDVIQQLGIEAILVYTALLLKKRVAVYHPDIQQLLNIVRLVLAVRIAAMPTFEATVRSASLC